MPDEIELKLRVRAADLPRLRRHPALKTAQPVTRRLVSIYYDTPDLALLDADLSLRVRRMSGQWFQAVKSAGHALAGLHQRAEWEDIIARGSPDFSKITDPALTKIFDRPELRAALRPIFTTDVRRTEWQLQSDDGETKIELALDVGDLIVGEQREPICEIELELKSGAPAHLFEFALTLLQDIPFHIENISKAQRGYAHYRPQPPAIRRAENIRLTRDMPPAEACRAMLRECLAHLQGNHDAVLDGQSEGVHQMRVALRRMRSVMAMFADFMPPADALKNEIRWLAATLGAARDLDVLLEETLPALPESLAHPGLAHIKRRARKQAQTARQETLAALDSQRYQHLLLRLAAWTEGAAPAAEQKLHTHASALLARRYRQLRKCGKREMSAEQRHALRISAKKLRYAAEFFADLHDAKSTRRFLRRLAPLLELLGELNDLEVTARLLDTLHDARANPALHEARLLIIGWRAARNEYRLTRFERHWKRLTRAKVFWE
ncbi:MAG: CHAD domain-containing protein [Methylobacillus sp.]|jgi:inorganic triphosphatase YgiF|nr:CHAD domain-containing protein [Methylobacillus sp.]